MRAWAIYGGRCYTNGGFDEIGFRTKGAATKYLRKKGYKYNKREDLFLIQDVYNDGTNEEHWARIEEMEFINE
jgi:hypothetical protein